MNCWEETESWENAYVLLGYFTRRAVTYECISIDTIVRRVVGKKPYCENL